MKSLCKASVFFVELLFVFDVVEEYETCIAGICRTALPFLLEMFWESELFLSRFFPSLTQGVYIFQDNYLVKHIA